MKELVYKVEFLSDIVLPATSNTEGNIQQLDFIAGSNFLGMVASKYSEFEDSFKVFHSGAVKFGDATLLSENKRTYKMPLSFFHEKANDDNILNHHLIEDFKTLTQLKQKRKGYITEDLKLLYVEYNYSQKSAYDKKHRRSKEGSLFGYSAMKKGLKWEFSIKIDNSISSKDEELIKATILNSTRLGKSKSAQYGLVKITQSKFLDLPKQIEDSEYTYLYLNSRIALVDECGNPTYDLKYLFNDLKDENILYDKCQIKTSTFTPYNGARQTKDYERVCINRGSVIVLKDVDIKDALLYVGAYQSEGFGEILVNPSFLGIKNFTFKNVSKENADTQPTEVTTSLAKFLQKKTQEEQEKLNILDQVDDFIYENKKLYKNIQASQWGKIRSICSSGETSFKEEIRKYVDHGVKEWDSKQIETLLKDDYSLKFIKLISIQMPKRKEQ